jgi:hypothetical protein
MSYWDFFPAQDGWGRVPMWGFAEVERSEAEGVEPGTRVYGYLPPSSHLLVTPVSVDGQGFVDGSPHREKLPSAYHRYLASGADPFYSPDTEAIQMLLRPLFFTSFLIDDQLDDEGLAGRGPILISSASSKTAIAAAFLLARREGVELVGLTSPRNREFVEGLGVYGRTIPYEEIGSLERGPATFVDFAGDGEVPPAVHSHFGDELRPQHGGRRTHWEEFGAGAASCPARARPSSSLPTGSQASRGLGPRRPRDPRRRRLAPVLRVDRRLAGDDPGEGFDAVRDAYLDVLEGGSSRSAPPSTSSRLPRTRASALLRAHHRRRQRGCRGGAAAPAPASRDRRGAASPAAVLARDLASCGRPWRSASSSSAGSAPSSARAPRPRPRFAARPGICAPAAVAAARQGQPRSSR